MIQDFAFLKRIYNAFDPFRPLPAGDPAYVDCTEVRGDGDILVEVGREILYSDRMTSQLYAGHRGAGKSTELLRLQQFLDEQGCFVVYFPADEQDIDPEDAQYTDILLACTRHLIEKLKDSTSPDSLLNWLNDRWQDLKDLALTKVSFESLSIEAKISQFAKLTANLRTEPTQRQKIRERVNPHTVTLIAALNEFIQDAKKNLPSYQRGINKVIEILQKRLSLIDSSLSVVDMFEEREALERLCLMSGGHVRNLLLLMKEAIKNTNKLPIPTRALQRSISELRNTYRNTVFANEWEALARVYSSKEVENDALYRGLLFNRCILEYRYLNGEGESQVWYDIHPLIKGIKEFQDTFNRLYPAEK